MKATFKVVYEWSKEQEEAGLERLQLLLELQNRIEKSTDLFEPPIDVFVTLESVHGDKS